VVLVIDIAVNFWRARALHRTARETKSQAAGRPMRCILLRRAGLDRRHHRAALTGFGYPWGDAVAAIAVAIISRC
jgi:divalent metal cation (Fe/Co/Zn/Cd) transporter